MYCFLEEKLLVFVVFSLAASILPVIFRMRSSQRTWEHADELSRLLVKRKRYHFDKTRDSLRAFFSPLFCFYVINGTQTQKNDNGIVLIWKKENPKWSSRNNFGCKPVFHIGTWGGCCDKKVKAVHSLENRGTWHKQAGEHFWREEG